MNIFKHKHKWQTRAVNRYGITTYRVCLQCGIAEHWEGGMSGKMQKCERLKEFDIDYDLKQRGKLEIF